MADFVLKNTAGQTGTSGAARLNSAGELVTIPWYEQLGLEGRTFIAGHGIEETATDSEASLDDTTPSFALAAPTTGKILVPLYARIYMATEGGAAPTWRMAYVQADKGVFGVGTTMNPLNLLGGTPSVTNTGVARHTLSGVTAITDAQNVLIDQRINMLDNFESVEAATTQPGVEGPGDAQDTFSYHWKRSDSPLPIFLYKGSSLLFYMATGTSDSTWACTIAWAELDPAIWIPG